MPALNHLFTENTLLLFLLALLYASFLLAARIFSSKLLTLDEIYRRNNRRLTTILELVNRRFKGNVSTLRALRELRQTLVLEDLEVSLQTKKLRRIRDKEIRRLQSFSRLRRKEASAYLAIIGGELARLALEKALSKEKDASVKIYISNALTDIADPRSIAVMANALIDTHRWYRDKAIGNLLCFGNAYQDQFLSSRDSKRLEWLELNLKYAMANVNTEARDFLFDFVRHFDRVSAEVRAFYETAIEAGSSTYKIQYLAEDLDKLLVLSCRHLADHYYHDFNLDLFDQLPHPTIRKNLYWAISKKNSTVHFKFLIDHLDDEPYERTLTLGLTRMIENNPRLIYVLEDAFAAEHDETLRGRMAQVLSNRIEYYLLQLNKPRPERARAILAEIIKIGKINDLIGFLNRNRDEGLNALVLDVIRHVVDPESGTGRELRTYLHPELLAIWPVEPVAPPADTRAHPKDEKLIRIVLWATLIGFFAIPILFAVRYWPVLQVWPLLSLLKRYILEWNYGIAYYSILVSLVTLTLIGLSSHNVKQQARLWNIKSMTMLFRDKMLPSISIIAPAFNEEKTIVASVQSLLGLKYPDYELIVVNDGSRDETLRHLIDAFSLVKVDYFYQPSLSTQPIRGIYRNPSLPKLIVVDKSNGGKADALNAGVNVAYKEYFCGIDSDSVLEPEALLRLASLMLDESTETPALGGNIYPINGCDVDRGQISKIRIPSTNLGRFQTIEYLRAFMIGRLGWQQINSLLIISGAFGLFRKDRIVGIGGYLTAQGQYRKDTVGEDMELVVRITRLLHEKKQRHKILYAYNANCWTEVPEDGKSLKSQRFRWQRGLIDILYFHKRMLFNRRYGLAGLLGMPYYLLFEAIGPMIELQGYVLVVIGLILGMINQRIALLLFIATVLLGIINSLASLAIAEKEEQYYRFRDVLILAVYAVLENFGPRQWISFWRIRGQLGILFGQGGWGKIQRKGIR